MSKGLVGESLAEMTGGQKADAAPRYAATPQVGNTDGSQELLRAYRDFLSQTGGQSVERDLEPRAPDVSVTSAAVKPHARRQRAEKGGSRTPARLIKQRFGLPKDFVPRLQRYGRSVLLELNVYRLPDGREFIPTRPLGTLGARQHMYALLNTEQYLNRRRGSIYVRSDGRIFDYSVDSANPVGDFFDTGFTIYDLERTGRYAPEPPKKKKRTAAPKHRRAAAAGSQG